MKTRKMRAPTAVQDFLSSQRFAFVGVSRFPKSFSRQVFRAFQDEGYAPVPVNPAAAGQATEGVVTVPSIAEVTPPVRAAFMMLKPEQLESEVGKAIEAGVGQIWIHGPGSGAAGIPEGVRQICVREEIQLVAGECPLMFLEGTGWIHRCHGALRGWFQKWPPATKSLKTVS